MVWTLFAYMFFWVAFFCLALVLFLYLSKGLGWEWMKRFTSRFGESPEEISHVQGLMRRFGLLFLALGVFLLLIGVPKESLTPEDQGKITLVQAGCAVVVFWQIRGIRILTRRQPDKNPKRSR